MTRTTFWADERGQVTQISVGLLDTETWEPQAVVTEAVGPFDRVEVVVQGATLDAKNLARRQLAGQLHLSI